MNNYSNNFYRFHLRILILMVFIFNSCEQKNLPPELVGKWKTGKVEITVRNRLERGKYEFTADTATITLIIDSSYTASGFIGSEKFENIRIGAYNTDDENVKRGFEYFVNPFVVGKIFANDPNADKEVIFKLNLLEETTIKSELCNRDFTMAEIIFTKEED